MTNKYTILYGHDDNCGTGILEWIADKDADVIEKLDKFVSEGFRNCTWATVELKNGKSYRSKNVNGSALGWFPF